MARRGIWSKLVICGALAALALTPALATEETAKEKKPAEKAATEKAEATKPAEAQQPDAEECKPTATRVNTLEDLFGSANWLAHYRQMVQSAPPVMTVAWRDATAESKPADTKLN